MNSTAFSRPFAVVAAYCFLAFTCEAQVNEVQKVAEDVYFHEGEIRPSGHCNNGWIIFEDHVLVIDGNFPSGAQVIIPKIRALTDKPSVSHSTPIITAITPTGTSTGTSKVPRWWLTKAC